MKPPPPSQSDWLSLTDLGRLYGISAVQCGRILSAAGLREAGGDPSREALQRGVALLPLPHRHNRSALWSRAGCAAVLDGQGLQPMAQQRLIHQWADLLEALVMDSGAVCVSAEEMAGEMPAQLVRPVNRELRLRGTRFQVRRPQASRRDSACRAAFSSSSRS
jgi:hypothetical protein